MSIVGLVALSAFPAILALFGGWMAVRTYRGRQRAADVEARETTDVAELQTGSGVDEVTGTARAADDELLPASMAETEGVAVRTVVEERSAGQVGERRNTDWDTVYADGDYVPFVVDDGTGEVPVRPPEDDVSSITVETVAYESEPGAEPSDPVQRWLAETDGIEAAVDEYRGYRQGVVEDGEAVYAAGEPVADGGGVVLTGDERPDEFVVSDRSKEEVAEDSSYGLSGYVIGGALLLVGLGALALLWL